MKYLVLAMMTLVLASCASSRGFNRGTLRESMGQAPVVDNKDIADALSKKAQLPKPFRIAVHFRDPQGATPYRAADWRWAEDDKMAVLKLATEMKNNGEVSDVFLLSPEVSTGESIANLRLAAARHGADALLIVSGATDTDRYSNKWGWTYAALVTALFIPATETDVLFLGRASLWDVRNEFLYMTAEAESVQKATAPVAWVDEKPMILKAKEEALGKLSGEISSQIKGLIASNASGAEQPRTRGTKKRQ